MEEIQGGSIVRAVDYRLRLIVVGGVIGPVGAPWWCAANGRHCYALDETRPHDE